MVSGGNKKESSDVCRDVREEPNGQVGGTRLRPARSRARTAAHHCLLGGQTPTLQPSIFPSVKQG